MSFVTELEAKLSDVKSKVEGDLQELVLNLEGIFHRVHQVQASGVFKQAVLSDIDAAVSRVEALADAVRTNVDAAAKEVDAVTAPAKKTTRR